MIEVDSLGINRKNYIFISNKDISETPFEDFINPHSKVFIITDNHIKDLFLNDLIKAIHNKGCKRVNTIIIHASEESKNFDNYEKIMKFIAEYPITREATIIGLGGGVVGDVSGFVAATLFRGINYISIPTTLVSQVDSSLGAKNGINFSGYKNYIGSFYEPSLTVINCNFLNTLGLRDMKCGYVEALKLLLVSDKEAAEEFMQLGLKGTFMHEDKDVVLKYIEYIANSKLKIIKDDPYDLTTRHHLNYGHTFAHAIEGAMKNKNVILHGEAVAIGIICANNLAVQKGILDKDTAIKIQNHIIEQGLIPKKVLSKIHYRTLYEYMLRDKKRVPNAGIEFVFIPEIGKAIRKSISNIPAIENSIVKALKIYER